jgi:hypothetical protein
MASRTPFRSARDGGLLLVVSAFAAIVVTHFDVIPFWDAKAYLDCVEEAVQKLPPSGTTAAVTRSISIRVAPRRVRPPRLERLARHAAPLDHSPRRNAMYKVSNRLIGTYHVSNHRAHPGASAPRMNSAA